MNTNRKILIAVLSLLALVLLVFGATSLAQRAGYWPGMMGAYTTNQTVGMMGGYAYDGNTVETKTDAEIQADIEAAQANAQVDETANSITYTGSNIKIVMLGGPEEADEKFVVAGLVNPTVYIPKDATVTLELVNADEGMPHAFEITTAAPPYYYMTMMSGGVYPGSYIRTLPVANADKYPVAEVAFQADTAGTFYYICQYPGHAAEGMYGVIVIE